MRPLVVVSAAIALGVLAAALARLGGTLAQLRALELPAAQVTAAVPRESAPASALLETVAPAVAAVASEARAFSEEIPASVANGDEHILRALAENPEFQRAAAELLLDPDPAVQVEARQLLRELGAAAQSE